MNWTLRSFRTAALSCCFAAAIATPILAEEKKEEPTLSEIVNILHEKGLIDDEEHEALAAKASKEQAKRSWTDRISLFGDLRGRFEMFDYDQDIYTGSTGERLQDRYRGRYRARLGVNAEGREPRVGDARARDRRRRSAQREPDDRQRQRLRQGRVPARSRLRDADAVPEGELPGIENGYLAVDVGKVKNPFIWKQLGLDNLLFDNDINPEGANLRITGGAGPVLLFANGGVYVIDENAASKDPKVAGGQLGGSVERRRLGLARRARDALPLLLARRRLLRARGLRNLAGPGGTGGNIIDGLARRNGSIQVAETLRVRHLVPHELFPVTFYGTYANNLSARNSLDRADRRTARTTPGRRACSWATSARWSGSGSPTTTSRRTRSRRCSSTATRSTARRTARDTC